jgi:2-polyprenyl-3-methyl-5-hydroxy-6-metoxy-1,4-benzoquinol methylase
LEYWNHNSAYHPLILRIAEGVHGDVLDVGCGEGLLVERLAAVSLQVVGIDRDARAICLAGARVAALPNAAVANADFMAMEIVPNSYDLITFVAVIHHLDLEAALRRARSLLRPGGQLVVVGLSADRTAGDVARSAALLPIIRSLSRIHKETRSVPVAVRPPEESFSEIKETASRELFGCSLRRGLYYRYVLRWGKPRDIHAEAPPH